MHSKLFRAARVVLPLVTAFLPMLAASAQLDNGSGRPITIPRPPQTRPYQPPNYGTGPLYQTPNYAGDARLHGMGGAGSSSGQQSQSGRSRSGGGGSSMMNPMMMMGPLRMLMGRMGMGMRGGMMGMGRSSAAAHGPLGTANGDTSMVPLTSKQKKQLEQMKRLEEANMKIQQAREATMKARSQQSQQPQQSQPPSTFSANENGEALTVSGEVAKTPEITPGLSEQASESSQPGPQPAHENFGSLQNEYRQPVTQPSLENNSSLQEPSTAEVKQPGEDM